MCSVLSATEAHTSCGMLPSASRIQTACATCSASHTALAAAAAGMAMQQAQQLAGHSASQDLGYLQLPPPLSPAYRTTTTASGRTTVQQSQTPEGQDYITFEVSTAACCIPRPAHVTEDIGTRGTLCIVCRDGEPIVVQDSELYNAVRCDCVSWTGLQIWSHTTGHCGCALHSTRAWPSISSQQ